MRETCDVIGERSARGKVESRGGSWMTWLEDVAACEITCLSTHDSNEHCEHRTRRFGCECGSLRESANGNKTRQKLSDQQSEGGVHARFLHAFCLRGQTCRSTDENNEPTYLVLIRASRERYPERKEDSK